MPVHFPGMGPIFKQVATVRDPQLSVLLWVPDTNEWQRSKYAVFDPQYASDLHSYNVAKMNITDNAIIDYSYNADRDGIKHMTMPMKDKLSKFDIAHTNNHDPMCVYPDIRLIDVPNMYIEMYKQYNEVWFPKSCSKMKEAFIAAILACEEARPKQYAAQDAADIDESPTSDFSLIAPHLNPDNIGRSVIRSSVDIRERMLLFEQVMVDYHVYHAHDPKNPPQLHTAITGYTVMRPSRYVLSRFLDLVFSAFNNAGGSPLQIRLVEWCKNNIMKTARYWPTATYSQCITDQIDYLKTLKPGLTLTEEEKAIIYQGPTVGYSKSLNNDYYHMITCLIMVLTKVEKYLKIHIEDKYRKFGASVPAVSYYRSLDMFGSQKMFSLIIDHIYLQLCDLYNVPRTFGPELFRYYFRRHNSLWINVVTSMAREKVIIRGTTSYHDPIATALILSGIKKAVNIIDLENKCARARIRQDRWKSGQR
jgi:hypothetical protein